MTNAELRQLEAEADAYQAQSDAERAAEPFRRIKELERQRDELLQACKAVVQEWDYSKGESVYHGVVRARAAVANVEVREAVWAEGGLRHDS